MMQCGSSTSHRISARNGQDAVDREKKFKQGVGG